jgi:Uma2 family endonuclease
MAVTHKRWTYDDLLELPDDGTRYEIIDGELLVVASPSFDHQLVVSRLTRWCVAHVEDNQLGAALTAPYDIVLPSGDTLQPDLVVFLTPPGDYEQVRSRGAIPDLAIEVHSPSSRGRDLTRKRQLYAEFGVKEFWPVDVDARAIDVLRLANGSYEEFAQSEPGFVSSSVIPGLKIDLGRLFFGLRALDR